MQLRYFTNAVIKFNGDSLTSDIASARYRIIAPTLHMSKYGVNVSIRKIESENSELSLCIQDRIDVVILSKGAAFVSKEFIDLLKANQIYVIVDICDNYFNHHACGQLYKDHFSSTIQNCNRVVTSSEKLSELVLTETGLISQTISDPYEFELLTPNFNPSFFEINLLWFGHESNIAPLLDSLPDIIDLSKTIKINLYVITGTTTINHNNLLKSFTSEKFQLTLLEWSTETLKSAIGLIDIIIIPTSSEDYYQSKSPNRLVESLISGKLVVAQNIPSYSNFENGFIECTKISEGIIRALSDINFSKEIIKTGQELAKIQNSKFNIGEQWLTAINAIREKVKLNLGCGDKYLTNYINIDIVASRNGIAPDIISNLNDLSMFKDNSVDEILSVHVIEHFWRWEVRAVLKEWYRVLKPTGKIILECPNLLNACSAVLDNPETATSEGLDGQRSMWVLYGDPSWQDPYMIHRWGYTPYSLISLLEEVGFEFVRQEAALFKLKEPRDMRITGIKSFNSCSTYFKITQNEK